MFSLKPKSGEKPKRETIHQTQIAGKEREYLEFNQRAAGQYIREETNSEYRENEEPRAFQKLCVNRGRIVFRKSLSICLRYTILLFAFSILPETMPTVSITIHRHEATSN